jgi:hypothetical protein
LTETVPTGPREWRKFGLLFTAVFLFVATYLLWKGKPLWWAGVVCAGVFGGAGLLFPSVLRLPHKLWMQFAGILGWVNTRVLLSLFFFVVLTPVGLIMRLFGRDPLAQRMSKEIATYWEKREGPPPDRSRFENLF